MEYIQKSITLTEKDLNNAAELQKRLPPNTLSGLIRYLFDIAIKNTDLFTTLSNPDKSNRTVQENLSLLKELIPKETEETNNRFDTLEKTLLGLTKQLNQLLVYNEIKDPELTDKVKKAIQPTVLGGKL